MDVANWMNRIAGNKGKSILSSTIITLAIIAMLMLSGPVQAVAVGISGLQDTYAKGSDIDFQVMIEINDPDKYVPVTNISLDFTGPVNKKIFFNLDGERISGDCNIKIIPVSIPTSNDFGYGSGYAYDAGTGYGYDAGTGYGYDAGTGYGYDFGYGYGYGYSYGAGGGKLSFIYNVSINTATRCLPAGNYSVVAGLNTGNNVVFRSSIFSFTLLPASQGGNIKAKRGGNIKAEVDIKPETINLESKGKFTAFISLPDGFDVRDIDVATVVVEGAHAVKSMVSKDKGGTLIAKFNTQDLEVPTGKEVKFTVTGELFDGMKFEGSDTVNVIKGQKEECECDDDDIEDGCDEYEDGHEHEDEYEKNGNNGGKEKVAVVHNNNIYITDNTGTVNINIYNEDAGIDVNHVSNDNGEKKGNGNKQKSQGNNNKKEKDK